jgi:hypothetical protein
MPRIRIKTTPGDDRVVGFSNCSTLTVTLVAHAQRSTLQLRADGKLVAGDSTLEHGVWDFPELPETVQVTLVPEPGQYFDPPDRSALEAVTSAPSAPVQPAELKAIEHDLKELQASLRGARYLKAHESCSFCGRSKDQVKHMVSGATARICDSCFARCSELFGEAADDV